MATTSIKLTQAYLKELLDNSQKSNGIDPNNAFVYVTENEGVLSAQYYGAKKNKETIEDLMDQFIAIHSNTVTDLENKKE